MYYLKAASLLQHGQPFKRIRSFKQIHSKVNQMLMHILLDEETNNIIILEFQGIKGSKTSPGKGL